MVSANKVTPRVKNPNPKTFSKVAKQKRNTNTKLPINKPVKVLKREEEQVTQEVIKPKKGKYVFPSTSITKDLVNKCLDALLDVLLVRDKSKNAIFDDEKIVFVEIHCIKIQNTSGNVKILLPHSTVASTGEVCLVTPDIKKGRKHDHEPTIDQWEELLKKAGVTQVKTVLPVRQIKVEHDQFELKRRLLTQHDFIMVDTRILSHVAKLFGKMFMKKHNMLIPVRINEKNVKRSIDIGLRTVMLRLNEGVTSTIAIGHTNMPKTQLQENLLALIEQLKEKYPGGEGNIRSINVKLPLSPSLPLYLTLRPSSTIKPPKLTQKRPKNYTVVEGELSTRVDTAVQVAPDGHVKVKKIKKASVSKTKKKEAKVEEISEGEELEDRDEEQESDGDEEGQESEESE